MRDLARWKPCAYPQKTVLEGRHVRLEPIDAGRHGDDLYAAEMAGDADARFRYLAISKPESRAEFDNWIVNIQSHPAAVYSAVIDKASGKAIGRQSLMRIDAANGVIEIGDIHWSPAMQGTTLSTEAFFLHAAHVFDDLGYRRFEWKLNNLNEPSHRAARRFGFTHEGLFRQHLVVKGLNRDTAWYAMLDHEWSAIRRSFERWLSPENFDSQGRQIKRLEELR